MRGIWLCLLLCLLGGCTSLFFLPDKHQRITPDQLGLKYESISFSAEDGVALTGWFLPAPDAALGTILFLHGNAENISTHVLSVAWLPQRGFNVFLIDYRGYGASEGSPDLPGVQRDIDAAMRELRRRSDVDAKRIVVYGQSLGGALAIYNVAHSAYKADIRAVISESAFFSYRGITREKLSEFWLTWPFQWLPSLTIDDRFAPGAAIGLLSPMPVLIVHGDQDLIVPVHHGRQLYDAAREPREIWIAPGGGHIQAMAREDWRRRFVAYLRRVLE